MATTKEIETTATSPVIASAINHFYEASGIPYCKQCGDKYRSNDSAEIFCPANVPNCDFVAHASTRKQ